MIEALPSVAVVQVPSLIRYRISRTPAPVSSEERETTASETYQLLLPAVPVTAAPVIGFTVSCTVISTESVADSEPLLTVSVTVVVPGGMSTEGCAPVAVSPGHVHS